jgi:hypothetical protein
MAIISKEIPDDLPVENFLARISIDIKTMCWNFAHINKYNKYGLFTYGADKFFRAHRVSYKIFSGKLIQGMVIDHICKNRRCVNPDHLRQISNKENVLTNSESGPAKNKAKTHCKHGHELSGNNLIIYRGLRNCRTCKNIRSIKYRLIQKELGEV